MKSILLVVSTLVVVAAIVAAQENPKRTGKASTDKPDVTNEKEVLTAIQGRLDALARRDFDAWEKFVADDMLAPRAGNSKSKQALVQQLKSLPNEVKYYYGSPEKVKVHIHGDTAVVTYLAKQYNDIGGQVTWVQTWQMETLRRINKKWLLIAVADAPILIAPAPATIDPNLYDSYAGQYEWAPTLIATISRDGDKLVQQLVSPDKEELLPENETTFFSKNEITEGPTSRYIFVKDASGKVTHYVYREPGGTDRIVKKIK